jgi:hypothetical protein
MNALVYHGHKDLRYGPFPEPSLAPDSGAEVTDLDKGIPKSI